MIYKAGPCYGIVTDIKDPDKLGRVKVMIPSLGKTAVTDWIPVLNLFGSAKGGGSFFLPDLKENVIIAFLNDNIHNPVVLGSVWSDKQKPPETKINSGADLNKDGENNLKFIKSRSGNMIILDDKSGDEKVQIVSSGEAVKIEMSAKEKTMTIESKGDIKISAKGKLIIESSDNFEVKSEKDVKFSSMGMDINSKKDVAIKASGIVDIKGATVKLN